MIEPASFKIRAHEGGVRPSGERSSLKVVLIASAISFLVFMLFVVVIVLINLRGVREASLVFAIPTYVFIGSVVFMIGTGLVRTALGDPPVASSAEFAVQAESLSQAAVILLVLRAFSSGCSAPTGRRRPEPPALIR